MKILVVSHSCATAANQRLYAAWQSRPGWSVTLAIPADWRDEFGNRLDETPVPELAGQVLKVPVWANGQIIFHVYRKAWSRFLDEKAFDAIYVNHEPYALATAQLCWANRRRAAFGFYSCQNIQKAYPFPISALERLVYRQSDFAFPITGAVDETLRAKGYLGESTVCPLPVDPERYFPRGEVADHQLIVRESGEVILGFVGRFVEAKGLRTLAMALGELADLRWKLLMIGTGPFQEAFTEILRTQGVADRVTFFGYIPHDETPRYLSALDLLVLPSETQENWKEQFGRVITESLACGTPVVGSDSGEIPTLIRASGGGLVFPEKKVNELARALRSMMTDPDLRSSSVARGRTWTLENVSLVAVAEKMAITIETVLNARPHAFKNP